MKFSFSITNRFGEMMRVDDAHSFDEAIERVEKGVYQRDLEIGRRLHAMGEEVPEDIRLKLVEAGEIEDKPPAPPEPRKDPPRGRVEAPKEKAPKATADAPAKPDMVEKYDADGNVIK